MSKTQRVADKVLLASELATVGSALGPVGTIGGALTGLLIGDETTVFPMDMIAIPAYQAYLLNSAPAFTIFIKEGEVLTQVQRTDAEVSTDILSGDEAVLLQEGKKPKGKKLTAYQRRYRTAFNKIKSKHKKKNGDWKKNGFRSAVREAHRIAGGKK